MHASVRPALTVNVTSMVGATGREPPAPGPMRMTVSHVNFFYGTKQTLFDINLNIAANKVTALIGSLRLRQIDFAAHHESHA